jgi:hypothetical protein
MQQPESRKITPAGPARFAVAALLLILLSLLPRPAAAQWREAWSFEPVSSPSHITPPVSGAPASVGTGLFKGALIGAAAGAAAFLAIEIFTPHHDHSEDGLVAVAVIVPATAVGAVVGAVVGAIGPRRDPE